VSEPLLLLTAQGARHVRQAWAAGEVQPALAAAHKMEAGAWWEPSALHEHVAEVLAEAGDSRTALDALLAPYLHQALPIDRVHAMERRLWHWLAVDPLRELMQRRWPAEAEASEARVARYLGRVTEHGLARLWWAAELTVSPAGTYIDTRRLVRSQRLMERVLRSGVGRSRTVMLGLLDAMHAEREWSRIDRGIRAVGAWSTTVCLEALDRTEVADLVRRALDP
jgi:hypothetical protein